MSCNARRKSPHTVEKCCIFFANVFLDGLTFNNNPFLEMQDFVFCILLLCWSGYDLLQAPNRLMCVDLLCSDVGCR